MLVPQIDKKQNRKLHYWILYCTSRVLSFGTCIYHFAHFLQASARQKYQEKKNGFFIILMGK